MTAAGTNATAGGMIAADSLSGDAYENLTNAALTVAYVISPRTAGGCFGNEVTVTMTINPEPVLASLDATVCSGESSGITLAVGGTSVAAGDYDVTEVTVSTGLVGSGTEGVNLADDAIAVSYTHLTLPTTPYV